MLVGSVGVTGKRNWYRIGLWFVLSPCFQLRVVNALFVCWKVVFFWKLNFGKVNFEKVNSEKVFSDVW